MNAYLHQLATVFRDIFTKPMEVSSEGRLNMAMAQIKHSHDDIIEKCYLAARGTDNLADNRFTRSQSYWKGRADAANDVRALKGKKNGQTN